MPSCATLAKTSGNVALIAGTIQSLDNQPDRCLNIIVYFDNRLEVQAYIEEALCIGSGHVDIALIVNRDSHGCAQEIVSNALNRHDACISLWDFQDNIGYLNSLLFLAKEPSLGKYKYYVLSNTDITYPSSGFFDTLMRTDYDAGIGCIAPSVYAVRERCYSNPHYTERISQRHFKRLLFVFDHPLVAKAYLRLSGLKARAGCGRQVEPPSQYVYSPHGCYMIFTRRFIGSVGGYEYGAKLYSEESCVGELLRLNGFRCYYDQHLKVEHWESTVTGQMPSKERFALWAKSIRYVLDEFY